MWVRRQTRAETGEDRCISALKKQINRCQRTFGFAQPVDELGSQYCLVFLAGSAVWSASLPLLWAQTGRCAAFGSGCSAKARRGCIYCRRGWGCWTKHSQWSAEGGGGETVAVRLGAGMVGERREGQKRGRKGRRLALIIAEHQGGEWRRRCMWRMWCCTFCDINRICVSLKTWEERKQRLIWRETITPVCNEYLESNPRVLQQPINLCNADVKKKTLSVT